MITLFIPIRHRHVYLGAIIQAWNGVDEIIVWQDGHDVTVGAGVKRACRFIQSDTVFGSHVKFKIAQLASHEHLLVCDDDIMPAAGTVDGMMAGLLRHPGSIISGWGRRIGTSYRKYDLRTSCSLGTRAKVVDGDVRVDMVGRLYFGATDSYIVPDIRDSPSSVLDDLYWSWRLSQLGVERWVVPFEWSNTPESNDTASISRSVGFWAERDRFCREVWHG